MEDRDERTIAISPRLMPGMRVGDAWVQVEPTCARNYQGKPLWRTVIDGPGFTYDRADLAGWGDAGEMLISLLSFLGACAEGRQYERSADGKRYGSDGASLFPEDVGAWAEQYSDELAMAQLELEEGRSP